MMDSRIIDVHFSRTFMKLVLGVELPLTIATVQVGVLCILIDCKELTSLC